jgi:hypothetical protein
MSKRPDEMTQDELLAEAIKAERLSLEMEAKGYRHAAWAYQVHADAWFNHALLRG